MCVCIHEYEWTTLLSQNAKGFMAEGPSTDDNFSGPGALGVCIGRDLRNGTVSLDRLCVGVLVCCVECFQRTTPEYRITCQSALV